MKMISIALLTLVAASAGGAPTELVGAAFCLKSDSAEQRCKVGWRWSIAPPSNLTVERFEPASQQWRLIEEAVGSKTGASLETVTRGYLYRVRACVDPRIDSTCASSTAFWAPYQPTSADEIPELVVSERGDIFRVSKSLPLSIQIEQYNSYQLAAALTDVAPDQLPPMTAPEKRWGAKGFSHADSLANNIYDDYANYRNPKSNSAQAVNDNAPKEFITDVPSAESSAFRAIRLKNWPEDNMIIFEPASPKYTVSVFADINCEHCKQILTDLDELNRMGVRVRFLAYPLHGPNSDSGRRMSNVWCAADPKASLKRAMANEPIAPAHCEKPIVAYQYALAKRLGIPGSPGIINENGELIGGYLPPKDLVTRLQRY